MAVQNVIDPTRAATALAGWWAARTPGATDVSVDDVSAPQSTGMVSETVLFTVTWRAEGVPCRRDLVARVAPTSGGLLHRQDLHRELAAMTTVRQRTAAPVPAPLAVEDDASLLGGPFLVMERRHGRVPPDDPPFTADGWVRNLTPAEQKTLFANAIQTLAEVHRADVPATAAVGLDQHLDDLDASYAYARGPRTHPTIEAGLRWLRDNRPPPGRTTVVWGDARIGNLMFDEQLQVSAVLDWDITTTGAPELDLGWFAFTNRMYTDGMGLQALPGMPTREEIVESYERASGHRTEHLEYYELLAAVRASIVVLRLGAMLIDLGAIAPDDAMPLVNPASTVLAGDLGRAPDGAGGHGWITGRQKGQGDGRR